MKKERGIHEYFTLDPEQADWLTWGRIAKPQTRRGFLHGLGTLSALLGAEIVYSRFMPSGLIPAVYADATKPFVIAGKNGLHLLNDRPLNAETPAFLLNDDITPIDRFFIRNNGNPPQSINLSTWSLTINGESVIKPKTYSLAALKRRFPRMSRQLTLECGGNGRSEFYPPAKGSQWTLGAVGCPVWDGIGLKDVLEDCGVKNDAVYIAYYGTDTHLSGIPDKHPISRGVPLKKAMDAESMIVWGMNGEDLHPMNGHPLRLVFGGWPGSTSGKWLDRISIRNKIHDGAKMTGQSYRVPCFPVAPGTKVEDKDMCIIESMPVKSLITYPKNGITHPQKQKLNLHGHAWAGENDIGELDISIDFGQTWMQANLHQAANRLAWQNWDYSLTLPKTGYYEVWARARDVFDSYQPMLVPGWNPKGYLNNSCHRIAVYAV